MGTIALVDSFTSTASAGSSYSKSCALGAEASDRVIAVVVVGQNPSSGSTYSCTIGGNAATQKVFRANNRTAVGIFFLAVPTGTTATVEVASTAGFDNGHFTVHRLTGVDAATGVTGSQTGTSTAASLAVTLNPTSAGVGLAGVRGARATHRTSVASSGNIASGSQTITAAISATDSAISWTGLTEDTEAVVFASGSSVQVMAVATWDDAAGPTPITATASGSIGTITGGAVASLPISGAAGGSIGAITGSATATLAITASALGSIGTITGGSAGELPIEGTATGNVGTIGGGATATLAITGAASGSIGLVSGAASGGTGTAPPVEGSAAGSIGTIGGSATASLLITGSATGLIGTIGGSAQGRFGLPTPVVWLTISAEEIDLAIEAEPIPLTITVSENGARDVKTLPNKTPQAVYRVTLNMPAWFTPDNPVVDLEMIPVRGDVVIADAQVLTASRAEFWLSGGTPGKLNTFTALAHLQDGQKYPQSLRLMVRETV